MRSDTSQRLLSREEVEDIFGITKRYLEHVGLNGTGPTMMRSGRSVRYRVRDIDEWIETCAVSS